MSRARSFSKLINKDNYATYRGSDSVSDISAVSLPQGTLNFRNKIINGDMRIDQRNAGSSITATNGIYLDRWTTRSSQASKYSVQQSTDSPNGLNYSLKVTSLSSYSITTSDYFTIDQRIETGNVQDFQWGNASGKSATLSFWVKSSLTGTFAGSISNYNGNPTYGFTYQVLVSDTWERKFISIPCPTIGSWSATINDGYSTITWGLGVGSDEVSTSNNSWLDENKRAGSGGVSVVGTSGATFYITGVQLEEGPVATPFEHRPYGLELSLCQRYFQSIAMFGLFVFPYHTTLAFVPVPLFVPLRSKSAVSLSKTDRIIRITTPAVVDYWIDGGNNFTSGGDWAHNMYIDNRANRDGSLSHLGLRINKSGSSNFPDQEPLEITGVGPNSSNNGFNDVGGYFEIESEL